MVKIVLPTQAISQKDIEIMLNLLERATKGTRHQIGLEIRGNAQHFQDEKDLRKIAQNINSVSSGLYLVVHGFSGIQVYESGLGDMRTGSGKELLETYAQLAHVVKADYLHVHSGAGYKGRALSLKEKQPELEKVRQNMLNIYSNLSCPLGIENLPAPSMGDVETDPEKVWRDCVDSLEDCLYIIKETPLKITLDTCHIGCDKKGAINLVGAVEKVKDSLYHLHISDVLGFWEPYTSVWQEGVVPGDGRIGAQVFQEFFRYLVKELPHISLCVEVYNRNFKKPVESEKALSRVLEWLG